MPDPCNLSDNRTVKGDLPIDSAEPVEMTDTQSEETKPSGIASSILDQFRQLHEKKLLENSAKSPRKPVVLPSLEEVKEQGRGGNFSRKRKTPDDSERNTVTFHVGLSEPDVGITEYISKSEGFTGIVKHRFSDFNVNEIDEDGNVIELTSKEIPVDIEEEQEERDDNGVLSEEQLHKLNEIASKEGSTEILEIDVTDKTKAERSIVHKAVKRVSKVLFSNTIDKDGKKYIKAGRVKSNERSTRPKNRGAYLHFTISKENVDTSETVHELSRGLRIKPNLITYAGTKDKRGRTTQRMCVKFKTAEALLGLRLRSMEVGNFEYKTKPLRLGALRGNRFRLAIRNVTQSDEVITESMKSLEENGFINYFGLQRFGMSAKVPSHLIGKALLSCDWKGAVELMLKPREGERCPFGLRKARDVYWSTKDPKAAVKCLQKNDKSLEGKVLRELSKNGGKDYLGAILKVPRNVFTLYLHAYQALIWNRIISRRIKEFGLRPIAGDLVKVKTTEPKDEEELDDDEQSHDVMDKEEENENTEDTDSKNSEQTEEISLEPRSRLFQVRVLTEEEAKGTDIYEVVYPLPGFDVVYPNNAVDEWFKEALAEDNLTSEMLKRSQKVLSLSGSYRGIVCKVKDLKWSIVKYKEQNDDLILSDAEKLKGKTLQPPSEDASHKAVLVEFSLTRSGYATMAIREVTKCDSSPSHHTALTLAHQAEPSSNKKLKPE